VYRFKETTFKPLKKKAAMTNKLIRGAFGINVTSEPSIDSGGDATEGLAPPAIDYVHTGSQPYSGFRSKARLEAQVSECSHFSFAEAESLGAE
jgi:hypothetical protein